jgi:hypothetical protein
MDPGIQIDLSQGQEHARAGDCRVRDDSSASPHKKASLFVDAGPCQAEVWRGYHHHVQCRLVRATQRCHFVTLVPRV